MKKVVLSGFCLLFVLFSALPVQAQHRLADGAETQYRRSSLYSFLIAHPQAKYASQIDYVYLGLPTPDKYEDHNLNVRRVEALSARAVQPYEITAFLQGNQVARRLVAKWFNRDADGVFNVDLVADRGNYNASEMDVVEARMTKRGLAMLSDAGEELIGNTFVTVNDIVYIDKEQRAQLASAILQIVAQAALVATAAADDDGTQKFGTDRHDERPKIIRCGKVARERRVRKNRVVARRHVVARLAMKETHRAVGAEEMRDEAVRNERSDS